MLKLILWRMCKIPSRASKAKETHEKFTMPVTSIPKYPVVDPNPSLGRTIINFNFRDYCAIGAFTVGGYGFGWFGARLPLRSYNGRFLGAVGLLAGLTFATQSSTQRFMGLEPNQDEVSTYGAISAEGLANFHKRDKLTNIELIDSE